MALQFAQQPQQQPVLIPQQQAAPQPFMWGQGGQAVTPEQRDRQRKFAEVLASAGQNPQNMWQGVQNASGQVLGALIGKKADSAEADQQARLAEAIRAAAAGNDPNAFLGVEADPFASQGQVAVADAMRQQALSRGNADLITDPDLREAVKSGRLPFETAVSLDKTTAKDVDNTWRPLTVEEAQASGLPSAAGFQVNGNGKIAPIGTGTGVTVNTGDNSSAFTKKADETAAVRMSEYVSGGNDAQNFVGDLQALADIGKQFQSGKVAEIKGALGPYAEALGVDIGDLDGIQAYNAIVARMAPQMRAPGSGASSDFDARQFLQSLPSAGNTPEGNQMIQDTFTAIQQRKIQAGEIAQQALAGQITWQEADKQINALGNPYEAFRKFKKTTGGDGKVTDMGNGITIEEVP